MSYHARKDTTRIAREYHAAQAEAVRRRRVVGTFQKLQELDIVSAYPSIKLGWWRRVFYRVLWWRH